MNKELKKKIFVSNLEKETFKELIRNNFGIKNGWEIDFVSMMTKMNIDWNNLTKKQLENITESLKEL